MFDERKNQSQEIRVDLYDTRMRGEGKTSELRYVTSLSYGHRDLVACPALIGKDERFGDLETLGGVSFSTLTT